MSEPLPGPPADGARRGTPGARRWGKWVWLGVGVVVVAGVAAFAWDALQIKESSAGLKAHAAAADQAVKNRDADALAAEVTGLQASAAEFANATDGPHWWVANHVPWIKNQTLPLSQAGESVKAIADDALGPISELGSLQALQVPAIVDGRIDPNILEPYRETLATAAAVTTEQQAALDAVNLTGTVSAVRTPFLELRTDLETLGSVIQGGHVAAEVLPSMLGASGGRTYLVMVQNNAEPRATGGIPGAVLEVTVDDGRMKLERYVSANSMIESTKIPGPLTDDELNIFTDRMLWYPQDVNFTPEYPRSAELMIQFWQREYGDAVDGVVSVDPVALGYMLAGMNPVDVQGVTITGENLSTVMLKDSYLLFPEPKDQDAFFAEASGVLFSQLVGGATSAVAGTEQAIDERRFLVWSAAEPEQQLLATTPVAGAFLEDANTMGMFVNDGSGSKIGYYIDSSANIVDHMCTDGSLRGQTVTLSFTHGFDGKVADLPWYVSGGGVYVPEGEFHANVLLYPAAGMGVTKFTVDGEPGQLAPNSHDGRSMSAARIALKPGETTVLTYDVVANEHGLLPPALAWTPGAKPNVYERSVDISSDNC